MNENEGMLFYLEEPRKGSFWMKNMHFPIDIIWLDENFSIVHIEEELQPLNHFIVNHINLILKHYMF
jgi:uncharacterized membrane protein (UPF0127 family)